MGVEIGTTNVHGEVEAKSLTTPFVVSVEKVDIVTGLTTIVPF